MSKNKLLFQVNNFKARKSYSLGEFDIFYSGKNNSLFLGAVY